MDNAAFRVTDRSGKPGARNERGLVAESRTRRSEPGHAQTSIKHDQEEQRTGDHGKKEHGDYSQRQCDDDPSKPRHHVRNTIILNSRIAGLWLAASTPC